MPEVRSTTHSTNSSGPRHVGPQGRLRICTSDDIFSILMPQLFSGESELAPRQFFFHFHCLLGWSGTNLYFDGYRSSHMWRSQLNGTIFLISTGNIIILTDWSKSTCLVGLTFNLIVRFKDPRIGCLLTALV